MAYGEFYVERQGWARWPKTLVMCRKRGDGTERRRYVPERTCRNMNDKGYSNRLECSACGYGSIVTDCRERHDDKPRYCPNCGAKVVDS